MNHKAFKKQKKLNDKGFSLVEVLVAVVILALVAGPILMAFVMSARFNARARETQRISTVAESVMEEFKGLSIKLARNPASGYTELSGAPSGYSFYKNVEADSNRYDVRVTATPLRDKEAENLNGADTSKDKVIKTTKMNPYYDYVYTQDMYQDKTVYDRVLNEVFNYLDTERNFSSVEPGVSAADLDKNKITVNRTVNLVISGNASTQQVKVVYTYTFAVNDYPVSGHPNGNKSDFEAIVYESPLKEYKELKNVYLFYSPGYKSYAAKKVARINNDTITVTNTSGCPVEAFVVKQDNPLYGVDLVTCNNEYFPTVSNSENVNLHKYVGIGDSFDGFNQYTTVNESLMYAINVEVFENGSRALGFPANKFLYTLSGTINSEESDG